MVTYYVKENEIYKVIATVKCDVRNASGSVFATCNAGETITFKAPSSKISLSDDNAALSRTTVGGVTEEDTAEHVCDPSIHVTPDDKLNWNTAVNSITTSLNKLQNEVDEHIVDTDVHVTTTDRYNWDKKLDYSELYDVNKIIAINGAETGNINTYGFTYKAPRSGYVTAITCCCDSSQTASTQAETDKILIKLWRADGSFLAVSGVSLEHQTGGVLHYWLKDAAFVKEGELLRVTFHAEGDDSTTYAESMVECYMETVAVTSSDQGGLLGSDGTVSNSTCVVKHTWYIDAEKFTPWEHHLDSWAHVTAQEKNQLSIAYNHTKDTNSHVTEDDRKSWGTCFVGEIKYYAGASTPSGWLLCNGIAVSRTKYPDLFNVIGTTFGEGDGSTTFNVPNIYEADTKLRPIIKF